MAAPAETELLLLLLVQLLLVQAAAAAAEGNQTVAYLAPVVQAAVATVAKLGQVILEA
jgi:hypothetical protein